MQNLSDLREQRSKVLADATVLMQNITPESRTAFDNAIAKADELAGDIKRLELIEAMTPVANRTSRPNPGASSIEERTAATKAAFRSWVVTGSVTAEQRDLLTITGNQGQALIPQAFYGTLIEAQKAWGGVSNVVTNYTSDSGAPMKISLANDTPNMLHALTQGVAAAENDPVLTAIYSQVDDLTVDAVTVSVAELQDSAFDLDSWIRGVFGKRYYRGLSNLITNGNASNFAGLISGYATNSVTTTAVGKIGYADIVALYAAIDPAYISENTAWVMNSQTRASLMGVTDTLGRPLFDPSPNGPAFSQLLGAPVVLDQNMPAMATGNIAIAFGDFKAGYLYRSVNPGLAITRLNEYYMPRNEVGFVGFARAGGVVTNAGIPPVVVLKVQ